MTMPQCILATRTATMEQTSDLGQHLFGKIVVLGLTVIIGMEGARVGMLEESLGEVKG